MLDIRVALTEKDGQRIRTLSINNADDMGLNEIDGRDPLFLFERFTDGDVDGKRMTIIETARNMEIRMMPADLDAHSLYRTYFPDIQGKPESDYLVLIIPKTRRGEPNAHDVVIVTKVPRSVAAIISMSSGGEFRGACRKNIS
jgi:hypothetical protein